MDTEPEIIWMTEEEVRARRAAALASVGLDEAELERRFNRGQATPDERDAWNEVEVADFLLSHQ